MAIGNSNLGLGFDITGNPADALRAFNRVEDEADRLKAKLRTLSGREVFKLDLKTNFTEKDIDAAILRDALKAFDVEAKNAAKGIDTFSKSASGGRSSAGQFIEAIAQGDPGELLGEIAQNGGKAGLAIAGVTIAFAAFAAGIYLTTKAIIENVREVDKLARDYKLASVQVQALQSYASLTGESVEDLAENYKKLGPEVKRLEALIVSSGAAIDNNLRRMVLQSSTAWEELKIVATGALNTIGRELLPVVTVALQDLAGGILGLNPTFKSVAAGAAEFFAELIIGVREAVYEFSLLKSGLANIFVPDENVKTAGEAASKIGTGFSQIGQAIKGNKEGIRADVEARIAAMRAEAAKAGAGPKVPSFRKAGGGKEDISELEKELRILRAAEAEARDLLDGRTESLEKYLAARVKVFEVERKLAEKELPNERAAKIAEIQQRETAATRDFFQELEKINEEAGKKAQKSVDDAIRVQQQRLEAERKFVDALKALDLERKDLALEREAINLRNQQETGLDRIGGRGGITFSGNPESDLRIQELELERKLTQQSLEEKREARRLALQQAEAEFADLEEQLKVKQEINRKFEQEEINHRLRLEGIRKQLKQEQERQDPTSARSLFGDSFANNLELFDGNKIQAMAATASESFAQMSAAAGNFGTMAGDAFNTFAQGIGSTVESFVLLGTTGPAVLRKMTAQILAQLANQAAVKAIFELAEGFALLFVNPGAAATHFKAAALYGTVAAVAGVAGRAVAGDLFKKDAAGGGGVGGNGGGARSTIIDQGLNTSSQRGDKPIVIHLRGEYQPGIIVKEVKQDFDRNGTIRQTLRSDIAGEGFSVV